MKIIKRRHWLALAIVLLISMIACLAFARPGGGSSYSGGGSRSSGGSGGGSGGGGGGGSGDGGAIVELLAWLCIEHPVIGIPLTIAVIIFWIVRQVRKGKQNDWSSGGSGYDDYVGGIKPYSPPPEPEPTFAPSASLDSIRRVDPNFSRIVFEDFLYSLYAEVHRARGARTLNLLSAYLSAEAMQMLQASVRGPIEGVIVGAMRFIEADAMPQSGARVVVEFESNYTEAGRGAYVVEQWSLARGPAAKSRTPERVRMLGCPSCGAPQESLFGGTCRHCSRVVNDGTFDWTVQRVNVMRREERPPILTANVEEQGTNLLTIRDPDLPNSIAKLRAKDTAFDVNQFQGRVQLVFGQFQIAWTSRNLAQMRPFLSDALFTTQQYWIQAYLQQQLRNVIERPRINNVELVKIASDAFFDAITIRLYAQSLDYTMSDAGKHMSGSRSKERVYSEYWTFIRGTNRKGPTRTDLACSNCGGPLDVTMAGNCKYCQVKVTTGDFDWVLSRIEQDESYSG